MHFAAPWNGHLTAWQTTTIINAHLTLRRSVQPANPRGCGDVPLLSRACHFSGSVMATRSSSNGHTRLEEILDRRIAILDGSIGALHLYLQAFRTGRSGAAVRLASIPAQELHRGARSDSARFDPEHSPILSGGGRRLSSRPIPSTALQLLSRSLAWKSTSTN